MSLHDSSETDAVSESSEQKSVASSGAASNGAMPPGDISILDLFLLLVRGTPLILRSILLFLILAGSYVLISGDQYRSEAQVVRESQTDTPNIGASFSSLRGLGINLGGSGSGLTVEAFSDVLHSREVRLAVVRDTFQFPESQGRMTFVEYASEDEGLGETILDYTIRLPFTLKNMLAPPETTAPSSGTVEVLTRREQRALGRITQYLESTVDTESGLMTIAVTAHDPLLAAELTQSFVRHLRTRVREIRTEKVASHLEFVQERFRHAGSELEEAENELAQFLERNQNPTTASLQFQRDRLRRQVSFKEQLYSDLQNQLTQAELDLQRRSPVVTVVERPIVPFSEHGMSVFSILFVAVIIGGALGVGLLLVRALFTDTRGDDEHAAKIRALKLHVQEMVPSWIHRRLPGSSQQSDAT
jgi:uncharacterized protein involved in exopolysaccharide biosynthesis